MKSRRFGGGSASVIILALSGCAGAGGQGGGRGAPSADGNLLAAGTYQGEVDQRITVCTAPDECTTTSQRDSLSITIGDEGLPVQPNGSPIREGTEAIEELDGLNVHQVFTAVTETEEGVAVEGDISLTDAQGRRLIGTITIQMKALDGDGDGVDYTEDLNLALEDDPGHTLRILITGELKL